MLKTRVYLIREKVEIYSNSIAAKYSNIVHENYWCNAVNNTALKDGINRLQIMS